jgi:hypothetical protein
MSLMLCVDNDLRFNKTREHFPSLKDYNDYLEEVEDMSKLFYYLSLGWSSFNSKEANVIDQDLLV